MTPTRFQTASPPLTRSEIVAAAMGYADRAELDQLTIRRLADDLDVTPMALYRHVRNKNDLLEQVGDSLLARAGLPDPGLSWSTCLAELAQSLRRLLRDHPVITSTFTTRPQTGEAARARLDAARTSLTGAGFDSDGATQAYAAVHTYTVGYCALEGARQRARSHDDDRQPDPDPLRSAIVGFVTQEQFDHGLDALIRGLSDQHSTDPSRPGAPGTDPRPDAPSDDTRNQGP